MGKGLIFHVLFLHMWMKSVAFPGAMCYDYKTII